jgi:3-phenylpropionate/trans-cinnamate dioxygenase ferredoxin reductase subunit
MLLGTGVAALEGSTAVERVRTGDGRVVDCDVVVVGIGVQPRTALAVQGRLDISDGIVVDDRLQSSVPGVFAAGDVALAEYPLYSRRLRFEHWANALHQGPIAARNMLGAGERFDRLPYCFSDQYDVGMEYTGFAGTWDRVVLRGDPVGREFIAFWLAGGRVVAGMNVGIWDVTEAIERLIRSRVIVDDRRLADPDVPLEELAHAAGTSAP